MKSVQKLLASFEEDGFVTDPGNSSVVLTVHCKYDQWQEYEGDPPKPTLSRIVGVVEAKDPRALFQLWEEQTNLQLRTGLRNLDIRLVNARGEFTACA